MTKKLYEESDIQAIADAIREKNGTTNTYTVAEMGKSIKNISSGSSFNIKYKVLLHGYDPSDDIYNNILSRLPQSKQVYSGTYTLDNPTADKTYQAGNNTYLRFNADGIDNIFVGYILEEDFKNYLLNNQYFLEKVDTGYLRYGDERYTLYHYISPQTWYLDSDLFSTYNFFTSKINTVNSVDIENSDITVLAVWWNKID